MRGRGGCLPINKRDNCFVRCDTWLEALFLHRRENTLSSVLSAKYMYLCGVCHVEVSLLLLPWAQALFLLGLNNWLRHPFATPELLLLFLLSSSPNFTRPLPSPPLEGSSFSSSTPVLFIYLHLCFLSVHRLLFVAIEYRYTLTSW